MTTALDHVQVTCPPGGEDAARAFYGGVLGLVEVPKPPDLAARGGAWFRLDDGRALHVGADAEHRPATRAHPGLVVDDLAAVEARLAADGRATRPDLPVDGRRRFSTTDPFGNRVEVGDAGTARPLPAIEPIGVVVGGRTEATDDDWGAVEAAIELDAGRFGPGALAGLDAFSHLDVVYLFHLVADAAIHLDARHPRGRHDWPAVGIFAQRAKARPNRLGVTTCELLGVDGLTVRVRGLDAIDGTPVLDLKPYFVEFAPRTGVLQPAWSHELMAGYWG